MAKPAARDTNPNRVRPGPHRPEGAPAGPDAVRNAVIEAAGHLFAKDGVDTVSLRDIAAVADVQLALIPRYFGSRDDLIETVFADLTTKIAQGLADRPLQQVSFEPDSAMSRWTALLNHYAATGKQLPTANASFNPVQALAKVFEQEYGLDPTAARLRGAQVVAFSLGWRVFEDYLISWGKLKAVKRQTLHDEVTSIARRIGATPWPSPPEPPRSGARESREEIGGREHFRE
jgi:AcrR family transcriptional regulator